MRCKAQKDGHMCIGDSILPFFWTFINSSIGHIVKHHVCSNKHLFLITQRCFIIFLRIWTSKQTKCFPCAGHMKAVGSMSNWQRPIINHSFFTAFEPLSLVSRAQITISHTLQCVLHIVQASTDSILLNCSKLQRICKAIYFWNIKTYSLLRNVCTVQQQTQVAGKTS